MLKQILFLFILMMLSALVSTFFKTGIYEYIELFKYKYLISMYCEVNQT